jgi:hypothetical protein
MANVINGAIMMLLWPIGRPLYRNIANISKEILSRPPMTMMRIDPTTRPTKIKKITI